MGHAFGDMLRRHRLRAALTQRELAGRAGVSVRALRDLEGGRVDRPRASSLHALAGGLGLPDADRAELLAAGTGDGTGPAGSALHVAVLGPLSIHRDGTAIDLGSPMQHALIGLLALQPGQVVTREEIIELLWGEQPPRTCANLVHVYIGRLRSALEPGRPSRSAGTALRSARGGYQLVLGPDRLDVARFDELLAAAGRATAPRSAHDLFERALLAWRGPVLADSGGDLGARLRGHPAAVALTQRRIGAALAYTDIAIDLGHPEHAVAELRALVATEPLHEGIHARLMLALAAAGQQAAALDLFATVRTRLADELGIAPGPEVQAAYLSVVRRRSPGSAAVQDLKDPLVPLPPRTAGRPVPAQLPSDVVAFTGRDEYLRRLDAFRPDPRAAGGESDRPATAIISGTAGVGKTALAVRWAHTVRHWFTDGQLHVNLRGYAAGSPLRPIEALARFLHALGVPAERVPADEDEAAAMYRSLLADRRVLVLLDNAHHPDQVRPLLPAGRDCMVLVTSRDPLAGLVARDGAQRLDVDVLPAGDAAALLARLLGADRADAEPEAVADLARLCAYLPLALRIAAANLTGDPGCSVAAYAERLSAGNRLAALAVGGDDQAAVRPAFEMSYVSLGAPARRLFRLLGLVPGADITVEAAAALSGDPAAETGRLLARLADACLIDRPVAGRFALHDLLRLYAAELAGAEDTRSVHDEALHRLLDYYLRSADAAARLHYPEKLRLPIPAGATVAPAQFDDPRQAFAWLDTERANLVAAVQHAAAHGPRPVAWLLSDCLRGYLSLRMYTVDWLAVAGAGLAAAEAEGDLDGQAAAHLSLAGLHWNKSRHRPAAEHHLRAVELARQSGWTDCEAAALGNLGAAAWQSGQLDQAAGYILEALDLNRRTGRLAGTAVNLTNLALLSQQAGRLAEAAEYGRKAIAMHRANASPNGEAVTLGNLGEVYHWLGRFDEALTHLAAALVLYERLDNRSNAGETRRCMAEVHCDAGRYAEARGLAEAALATARDTTHLLRQANALNTLAALQQATGHPDRAADLHQQALATAGETGDRYPAVAASIGLSTAYRRLGEPRRAHVHARQALADAKVAGLRLLEGQAGAALAAAVLDLDQPETAVEHAERALAVHEGTGHRLGAARTLVVLGDALRRGGHLDAATARWRQAEALFAGIGSPEVTGARDRLRAHPTG